MAASFGGALVHCPSLMPENFPTLRWRCRILPEGEQNSRGTMFAAQRSQNTKLDLIYL
jgi:hypothetical protein